MKGMSRNSVVRKVKLVKDGSISLRISLNDTVLFERLKSPNLALLGNSSKSLICEGSQQEVGEKPDTGHREHDADLGCPHLLGRHS
ncbi:uncharacterized protein C17orf67 homolog isoform X2 [Trachypithecus francoisi]|uniref:uncharacterized protein C17orf67 homolog isoform X2 n=1 Tax=Trachypithecus francoisi TaxID=54180 RepID=UPI00141B43ED|nr:uncharacterized protein C17orf67 homolog isoform X2 [Trachypithecus francoisi]